MRPSGRYSVDRERVQLHWFWAVADQRGWQHHRHRHYRRVAKGLRPETGDSDILRFFNSAGALHENFCKNDTDAHLVAESFDDVGALLGKLIPLLDEV